MGKKKKKDLSAFQQGMIGVELADLSVSRADEFPKLNIVQRVCGVLHHSKDIV